MSRRSKQSGFTLVELLIVVAIIVVITAVALPTVMQSMKNLRLQGATRDFSSVLQQGRFRSVRDNTFYATRYQAAAGNTPQMAYVDIPGGGGQPIQNYTAGDPVINLNANVTVNPGGPPATAALQGLVLPAASTITLTPGPPIYFNDRGLPCTRVGALCNSLNGGGLPTAYVTYFQSTQTQNWQAVTVTPAGRIQVWAYDGGAWFKL